LPRPCGARNDGRGASHLAMTGQGTPRLAMTVRDSHCEEPSDEAIQRSYGIDPRLIARLPGPASSLMLLAVPRNDGSPQALVLDVGEHPWMGLGDASELGLPVAIADHPVDVATRRRGLPAGLFAGGEAHVGRRARGVIGIGDRLDPLLALKAALAGKIDAVGRLVGDLLIEELGGEGPVLADQVALVDPAARDLLQLAEQMQLRLLAGIAELPNRRCLARW
jgi:hypothetical protein